MGESILKILLVEDNVGDARLLRETLRDAEGLPHELMHVQRLDEAINRQKAHEFDVLLLDLSLPDSQGIDTVKRMTAASPGIPVLVLTGTDDAAMGTEAVRCGAQDYLVKGQTDHRLLTRTIRYAIERKELAQTLQTRVEELGAAEEELRVQNDELVEVQRAVEEQRHRYEDLFQFAPDGYLVTDAKGVIEEANRTAAEMMAMPMSELRHVPLADLVIRETNLAFWQGLDRLSETAPRQEWETRLKRADGTVFDALVTVMAAGEGGHLRWLVRDITQRKRAEREREAAVEFLRLVNASVGVHDLVEASVRFFRKQSGCEAVGIRLRDGDDYPYYETHGFPEEFVRMENSLCARCQTGELERDAAGNAVLECMCGNVISGRFDPTKPFFTPQGSFWANDTTRLLATTTDADRQAHTRNRCNGMGYESVALIALRVGEQRLGLLQLNDHRKNMFTAEGIALWERLAGYLAVALAQAGAEEALRKSEQMHRVFFDLGVVGMVYVSMDGRLVKVNDKYCQITGYTRQELTGMAVLDLDHPDDRQADREQFELYLRGQQPVYAAEKRYLGKDGSVRWVSATARLVHAADGRPRYSIGIIEDISQRKQAKLDEDLATQVLAVFNRGDGDLHTLIGEVLRLIRHSIGFDAVGLRLREGDDCPYYQQDGFSDEFLREENFLCAKGLDGTIVHDACGQSVLECTCGLVLSGRTDPTMPCFTEGGSFWTNHSPELLALAPQDDPRTNPRNRCIHVGYESVALMPVRSGDQIIGLLQLNDRRPGRFTPERIRFFEGLANNFGLALTRRQAEEELTVAKDSAERAKAAAEHASKAKDHFLAVLSHELRTPLTPVVATVSMLQEQPQFDAQTREHLEVIRRNVELEARLIDDLLDVTRISRGKVELDRQHVELGTVIGRAVEVCKPDIEARRLHFGVDIQDGPHFVYADIARLQQVFWNLLKNAIKFTPPGGCLGVRCWREDEQVIVEVNDSGAGIEPEALTRIFSAFEQAERSITRQFGGLGLGLTISKAMVEMHGGAISAHSEGKGKGATFTVRLPLVPGAAAAEPAPSSERKPAAQRPLRILLVEDHGDTARIMQRILVGDGHEVETAADVATALDLAGRGRFDLLLSDLGLPDGSGIDLMRQLRERGLSLPGIALSGYGQEQDVQRSRQAGFAAHLIKPVSLDHLASAIATATGETPPPATQQRDI